MQRPDREYVRLCDSIESLVSGSSTPSLRLAVRIAGDISICVAYVAEVALGESSDAILFGGPIKDAIWKILKEIILDKVRDPAVLDQLGKYLRGLL